MEYTLEKLEVYQLSEAFSDVIWNLVSDWDHFKKDTIGKQLVRAADPISANIAEGYGRYYYKESKQFFFYSRGSLQETKSWIAKCKRRNIIKISKVEELINEAEKILAKINGYIKFIAASAQHNKKD
ncbi:MAG: four helix bundle protein [Ferruginibacter sp.]